MLTPLHPPPTTLQSKKKTFNSCFQEMEGRFRRHCKQLFQCKPRNLLQENCKLLPRAQESEMSVSRNKNSLLKIQASLCNIHSEILAKITNIFLNLLYNRNYHLPCKRNLHYFTTRSVLTGLLLWMPFCII